jgi:hypothetical protein
LLSVRGRVGAEVMVNPVPAAVIELTTTAAEPAEVNVMVCVAGVPTFTSPKLMLVAFTSSRADPEPSANAKVCDTLPAVAVNVTAVTVLTEETVAVKPALDAPAATVTDAGTVTTELLLPRLTVNPPVAAAVFSVTVQLSVPVVVIDEFVHVSPVKTGTAEPLRPTTVDVPVEELLVNVSDPVAEPAAVGLNCNVRLAVCVGLNVSGKVAPDTEKPDPLRASALTVTDADPVEDKVMVCDCGVPTDTLVKLTLAGLTVKTGVDAPRARAKA